MNASGLRVSTIEFASNLAAKCSDKQFCLDIVPLLQAGVEYDVSAAASTIAGALVEHIDEAWERYLSLPFSL